MKHSKKILLAVTVVLISTLIANAQGPGFDDDVVDEIPLDGGVSALIVAGAAYGAKKLKDAKRNKQNI